MLRLTITKKKFSLNYREVLKDGLLQTLGVRMVVFWGTKFGEKNNFVSLDTPKQKFSTTFNNILYKTPH